MNYFIRLVFIAAFLLLYLIAIIILKPLRQHVKRKYSTIALKFSYLLYLAIFLIFTYLFMFYNGGAASIYLEDPDNPKAIVHFSFLLLAFIIPNTGILIRRKIKWRKEFNIIMSFVNFIFGYYLWRLIETTIK
jgi:hypothetical protein